MMSEPDGEDDNINIKTKIVPASKDSPATLTSPIKGGKGCDDEPHPPGVRWLTFEHKGPYFAPPYERLPPNVNFLYNGKPMALSEKAEEAAGLFAKSSHDYTTKEVFCKNFFQDWRKEMTAEEAAIIKSMDKCDFTHMHQYYTERSEERKAMTKDEKLVLKQENEKILEEYGWCVIDGHKERIDNFRIIPPGLFKGRGNHPKQGKIRKRIEAKDVLINIGKGAEVPSPPPGQHWKEVQHDNKVTWLASWTEDIQGSTKYVMLKPKFKEEQDILLEDLPPDNPFLHGYGFIPEADSPNPAPGNVKTEAFDNTTSST